MGMKVVEERVEAQKPLGTPLQESWWEMVIAQTRMITVEMVRRVIS